MEEEEVQQNVERTGVPSERMGDLFLKIFGPERGVDLELPKRQPHEAHVIQHCLEEASRSD